MRIPARLEPLVDLGVIQDVVRPLMSGKEASVYLVEAGGELRVAKVYKAAGYDTGYVGKWHIDGQGRSAYIPEERRQGFDYWKVLECTHNYNHSKYYVNDDPTPRLWDGYDALAAEIKPFTRVDKKYLA